jgi:hypothetical protein
MLANLHLVSLDQLDTLANILQPIATMESLALLILATPKLELVFTPSKLDANALMILAAKPLQLQTTSTTARLLCTTQPLKPAKSSQFLEPSTTTALLHHLHANKLVFQVTVVKPQSVLLLMMEQLLVSKHQFLATMELLAPRTLAMSTLESVLTPL